MDIPTKSSYTYRIPLDDTAAMMKIRRFERKPEYFIRKLNDDEVPNSQSMRHWGAVFYESKETRGDQIDDLEGGVIPGLHKYRYSLDWEPLPENALISGSELIEMRYANGGGTRLNGEYHIGTSDPRLSNYAPIDFNVDWTPGEIKKMYNGEDVPNKLDYSRNAPIIDGDEAAEKMSQLIVEHAHEVGYKKMKKALRKRVENCPHHHVVKNNGAGAAAYCEDCGRDWLRGEEIDGNVVGTTA